MPSQKNTNETLFPTPITFGSGFVKPNHLQESIERGEITQEEANKRVCYLIPKGIAEKICFRCNFPSEGKYINLYTKIDEQTTKHELKWKCKDSREICDLRRKQWLDEKKRQIKEGKLLRKTAKKVKELSKPIPYSLTKEKFFTGWSIMRKWNEQNVLKKIKTKNDPGYLDGEEENWDWLEEEEKNGDE